MNTLKSILLAFTMFFVLVACNASSSVSKEDMQNQIIQQASEQVSHLGITATECFLVKESENKYTGFVKFDNGEQQTIDVTVDGQDFLWKAEL